MSGNKRKKISVTELVEFSARCGDLYTDFEGPTSLEGIRGHQRIQKKRKGSWESEIKVSTFITINEIEYEISGRVDLINSESAPPVIEEIKTTYRPMAQIPEGKRALHLAQTKIYAALYARQTEHLSIDDEISTVLTWFNIITNEQEHESDHFRVSELQLYLQSLIEIYAHWHQALESQRAALRTAIQSLEFPFPNYRPGQLAFARHIYKAIREQYNLMVEAPTGTGKTISTLFPSIKAYGASLVEQITYLTAKGSGQRLATETMKKLFNAEVSPSYVVIQSKEKACPCKTSELALNCRTSDGTCVRTIGFFDRLPSARLAALNTQQLDTDTIQKIADEHQLCPFELSLQLARWVDMIICDLNYVYDPMVRLPLFDERKKKRAILVDEFHNLASRSREMYSAELSYQETLNAVRSLGKSNKEIAKSARSLARTIKRLHASLNNDLVSDEVNPEIQAKIELLNKALHAESNLNDANQLEGENRTFAQWLKSIYRYIAISQLFNPSHKTLVQKKEGDIIVRLFCRDASSFLAQLHKLARATVGFSATLKPDQFYKNLSGFSTETLSYALSPIFPPEHQLFLHCAYIDTRWEKRSATINTLIELIHTIYETKPGKYIVYFPSYHYLEMTHADFKHKYPDIATCQQTSESTDDERHHFTSQFFSNTKPIIGFAIVGGIFGEGIDFVGESLIGSIIIGTGMPQPSIENKLMEEHFTLNNYNSFQYVYQFPGLTRIEQTAGRVIRSETDKGIIVLVDPRFSRPDYLAIIPPHWQLQRCTHKHHIVERLQRFWSTFDQN